MHLRSKRSTFIEERADGADELACTRHDCSVTCIMEGMHNCLRIDSACLGTNSRTESLVLVGFQDENFARSLVQVSTAEMIMCGKVVNLFGHADKIGFMFSMSA
jgi:hypothetical protein